MTWGAKVSQPGVNADQAADYQLAFSSEWPTLKIYKSQAFNMSDISQKQTIYSHSLSYPPVFMIQTTNTSGLARIAGPGNDEYGNGFYVDNDNLGFDPALVGGASGTYQGRFFIFTTNLLLNYQAPVFTTGLSALQIGSTQTEGIVASIPGQDVITSQPQNLSVNSEARAPMIHSVLNGKLASTGTDYSLVSTHALDYPPYYLTFIAVQGTNTYRAFFGGNGTEILKTTTTTVEQHSSSTNLQGSIVIMKDPFLV